MLEAIYIPLGIKCTVISTKPNLLYGDLFAITYEYRSEITIECCLRSQLSFEGEYSSSEDVVGKPTT